MQDLENGTPDRFLSGYALHARLALPIPCLNAVLAIDHIQADGQGIDDLGGEAALLFDLHRPLDDFALEAARVFGRAQRRGEHVSYGKEDQPLVCFQRLTPSNDERAEDAMAGEEAHADKAAARVIA